MILRSILRLLSITFFFFNDTATTEIYTRKDTLSLHDALPISSRGRRRHIERPEPLLHGPHRGPLPPLRRSPRPRLRRRPGPHRAPLLHERRGAQLRPGVNRGLSRELIPRSCLEIEARPGKSSRPRRSG